MISVYSMDQSPGLFRRTSRITLTGHKSSVHTVRWSPDGSYLASGGKDKNIHLHRVTESDIIWEQRHSTQGHTSDIDQLCWNPKNSNLLATASMDKSVKVWDLRLNRMDPISTIKLRNENLAIAWSNDGSTVAVADRADVVTFLDAKTDYSVLRSQKFYFEIGEITWNIEDDLFFVTSGEGKIHVLNNTDLQTLLVIDAFASPCICIRFDPKGKYFAAGSNDAVTGIWDSENLICVNVIDRLEWPIKTISFSHDGRYLASGSEDQKIDISDVQTGKRVDSIDVNSPTLTLDFHPKDYYLAYALDDHDYREIGGIKVVGFPETEIRHRNHNH